MPSSTRPFAARGPEAAPIFERDLEIEAIDRAIERARGGSGSAILVVGEAGIGKSTLVGHAIAAAGDAGLRVLRARGSELERALPYGIVSELFGGLAREPGLAADVLGGPARVIGPLLGVMTRGAHAAAAPEAPDPLAYLHGLFWLTLNLADSGPLAIVVDDAQWADEPSLRFLHRVIQRIDEVPALVVLAMRPEAVSPGSEAGARIRTDRGTTHLIPAPLSEAGVGALLASLGGGGGNEAVRRATWQATRGNPFFVTELASGLAGAEPGAASAKTIATFVPEGVGRYVRDRLAAARPEARRLAEAVAILGDHATLHRAAVLAGLAPDAADEAAVWLVEAAIFDAAPTIAFRHPIVQSGVDSMIPGPARSSLHRRAAFLLADDGVDIGVVGAHLREAGPSGERRTVELLRAAATHAGGQGEPDTAVALLQRALAEPPPPHQRTDLLVELARAEAAAASPAAADTFVQAIGLIHDRRRRAQLDLELGHVHVRGGDFRAAAETFSRGMAELADARDPVHARLEAGFVASAWMGRVNDEAANRIGGRILSDSTFGPAHRELVMSVAFQRSITGTARCSEMLALVERVLGEAPINTLMGEGQLIQLATGVLFSTDELDIHRSLLTRALDLAEQAGDYAKVGLYASARAWSDYFGGRLADAIADTDAGIRASELGWEAFYPAAVGIQAMARIERGELAAAEAVLAIDADGWSSRADWIVYLIARARLFAARGEADRAVDEFSRAAEFGALVGYRNPGPPAWRRWLAETLARIGDRAEARRVAGEAVSIAEDWGARWPLGAALRVAGLAEGGPGGIAALRQAEELLRDNPARLEAARVLVDLGAALRRNGSLTDARETLLRAADLSRQIGARALLARATTELRAAGARPRRVALTGVDALTPAELRVAREALAGRTNREIAQALFVTPKAIEYHLANTYRKLAIGSRAELAGAMTAESART